MEEISIERDVLVAQNPGLVEITRPYYEETLEYHNFNGHILGTWESARKIARLCIGSGLAVNLDVIDRSVLFHDADVHKPLTKRYPTLERRSAAIARKELRKYGDPEDTILHTSASIISTTYGVKPKSIEAAIIKRADILNIGQDYKTFISNSVRLLREQFRLRGLQFDHDSVDAWIKTTASYLSGHLRDDEPFGDFDLSEVDPSCSLFKSDGMRNVNQFMAETYESINKRVHDIKAE